MEARREQNVVKFHLSDKNVRGYMERKDRLWIERGGREMNKQSLRMQVKNIENNKLLSNVEI